MLVVLDTKVMIKTAWPRNVYSREVSTFIAVWRLDRFWAEEIVITRGRQMDIFADSWQGWASSLGVGVGDKKTSKLRNVKHGLGFLWFLANTVFIISVLQKASCWTINFSTRILFHNINQSEEFQAVTYRGSGDFTGMQLKARVELPLWLNHKSVVVKGEVEVLPRN